MSLYNSLFKENEDSVALLGMIGCTKESIPRYRDVFICDKGENIIIYTRTGGGNRGDYQEEIDKLKSNPNYLEDYDDDFDETYAYFKFKVPEKYSETTKKLFKEEPETVHEKFERECNEMNDHNSEAFKRAEKLVETIMNQINDSDDNGNIHIIKL